MDLSKIDGLTEEQKASITQQFSNETEGLRKKNEELLGEKKSIQGTIAEQAEIAERARQAAVTAEEARLKATNDMDGLKSHYEKQLAEQTATANESAKQAKEALLARDKSNAINSALTMIHDKFKPLAKATLSNMLNISYNDQGVAITEYKYEGNVVATNQNELKEWAKGQAVFKQIMTGADSSGAGSGGGGSIAGGGTMTLTEKAIYLNENPQATL